MANFQDIITNFSLMALLLLGVFSLIVIIQYDNNAPDPLMNNDIFGGTNGTYLQLQEQINTAEDSSATQYDKFSNEKPVPGFGTIILFSVVGAGKTLSSITIGMYTILIKLPLVALGIDESVVAIVSILLIVALIVALWIFYKLGG